MNVEKKKALISCMVTAQLICAFVFCICKKVDLLMMHLIWQCMKKDVDCIANVVDQKAPLEAI